MNRSKLFPYLGVLTGIVAVITALVMLFSGGGSAAKLSNMSTGTYTSYSFYGGDAYTGIQQASADAARNVKTQSDIIIAGFQQLAASMPSFAPLLLFFGLALIFHFGGLLHDFKARDQFEAAVLKKITDPSFSPAMPGRPDFVSAAGETAAPEKPEEPETPAYSGQKDESETQYDPGEPVDQVIPDDSEEAAEPETEDVFEEPAEEYSGIPAESETESASVIPDEPDAENHSDGPAESEAAEDSGELSASETSDEPEKTVL